MGLKGQLLILGLNYAPEVVGIAPYTTDLAEHLAHLGHDVTVLTSYPHYPHWRIDSSYKRKGPFMVELRNGVRVIRSPLILPGDRLAILRRIAFDSSIAATSLLASAKVGPVSTVICISPPLQLGITAWLIARARGARLVVHLQDVVPDAALSVGMMREGIGIRLARRLERFVYSHADVVTVVSQGFVGNLEAKGVERARLRMIPNWVDAHAFDVPSDPFVRDTLGAANGRALALHAGNMGAKQGLRTVLEAAVHLVADDVIVALVGDGNQRGALEARAARLNLSNVRILPLQPSFQATLAAADILILSQRSRVIDSVAPSKLLGYMASGRPVVAAVNGSSEAARLIREASCGLVVSPEDPLALADAIRGLLHSPVERASFGAAGRRYVSSRFDRTRVLAVWSAMVSELGGRIE